MRWIRPDIALSAIAGGVAGLGVALAASSVPDSKSEPGKSSSEGVSIGVRPTAPPAALDNSQQSALEQRLARLEGRVGRVSATLETIAEPTAGEEGASGPELEDIELSTERVVTRHADLARAHEAEARDAP